MIVLMLELKDKLLAQGELEAGRVVQKALAPEVSPRIPGWSVWLFTRTANEVGGDLVDVQKTSDTKFRIALADVAGKGLSAALLTAKLQATLRALAPDIGSITETIGRLNTIFYRDSPRRVFTSLIYVEMQADSGVLKFVNAGHLPPLHLRGTKITEMAKGRAAIGLLPDSRYSEQMLEVSQGDCILICSDGLSDAKNAADEFLGIQWLMNILSTIPSVAAPEFGMRLVKEVDRFIGDAKVFDDISLVVLRREA